MSILILALVVVIIAFLLCYAVDASQVPPPLNPILKVIIILIAVVMIGRAAGLL